MMGQWDDDEEEDDEYNEDEDEDEDGDEDEDEDEGEGDGDEDEDEDEDDEDDEGEDEDEDENEDDDPLPVGGGLAGGARGGTRRDGLLGPMRRKAFNKNDLERDKEQSSLGYSSSCIITCGYASALHLYLSTHLLLWQKLWQKLLQYLRICQPVFLAIL